MKELTGEEFGVYVKRILPGGLASTDGKTWNPETFGQGVLEFRLVTLTPNTEDNISRTKAVKVSTSASELGW